MPAIVAFFVRQLLIIGVQLGIFAVIDRLVTPWLNSAVEEIAVFFGVTRQNAEDILANEILRTAESLGLTVALAKARLPLQIAERLGFTSRGFVKRALPTDVAQKVEAAVTGGFKSSAIGSMLGKGTMIILGGGLAWNLLTDWVWIGSSLNILPEGDQNDLQKRALSIQQLINSPREIIYSAQKTRRSLTQQERALIKDVAVEVEKQITELEDTYSHKFVLFGKADVASQLRRSTAALRLELNSMRQVAGLIPRQPIQKTTTEAKVEAVYDGDTIKLSNGETVRLVGIDAPESTTPEGERSKAYLKARLLGETVRVESDPDALLDIYGRRLGVIVLEEKNINIEMLQKGFAIFYDFAPNALVFKKQWTAAVGSGTRAVKTSPLPKVFTGIISQGTLGEKAELVTRPSDIIGSTAELQTALQNNLAPFLATVPGRVLYELKIVPRIVTKDGTVRNGATQTIATGTRKDGSTTTKTLTNKFAVVYLYFLTDKGTRARIATLVLGPTDAVKFRPEANELILVEATVRQAVVTTKTAEIMHVAPSAPLPQTVAPQQPLPTQPAPNQPWEAAVTVPTTAAAAPPNKPTPEIIPTALLAPQQPLPAPPAPKIGANANTLFEWYTARGESLPSVSARATIYQSFGLGSASLYVGTAEQNSKLLTELKARA